MLLTSLILGVYITVALLHAYADNCKLKNMLKIWDGICVTVMQALQAGTVMKTLMSVR